MHTGGRTLRSWLAVQYFSTVRRTSLWMLAVPLVDDGYVPAQWGLSLHTFSTRVAPCRPMRRAFTSEAYRWDCEAWACTALAAFSSDRVDVGLGLGLMWLICRFVDCFHKIWKVDGADIRFETCCSNGVRSLRTEEMWIVVLLINNL